MRAACSRPAGSIGRAVPCGPSMCVQRGSTSSEAPLACTTNPTPSTASTVDILFNRGSNRNSMRRCRSRSSAPVSTPCSAAYRNRAISVGSPCARFASTSSATLHTAIVSTSSGGGLSVPSRGDHQRVTRIEFWVRVPVLSVQITVVEPSVSTAESRLTTAPRRASDRTPTASARVMVGSSPSGTLATNSPTAKTKASCRGSPASVPSGRKAAPTPTATTAISQATRRTCRSSGLCSVVTRSDSAAIRPSSVCVPVANTTARAVPATQEVPLNTTSTASISRTCTAEGSACRDTGWDSPVRADTSASTAPDSSLASAEIRSPSSITSTSPGTSSSARTVVRRPSRSTAACGGRKPRSASTARSACCSCAKARPALSTITATIAAPNTGVPAM